MGCLPHVTSLTENQGSNQDAFIVSKCVLRYVQRFEINCHWCFKVSQNIEFYSKLQENYLYHITKMKIPEAL